MARSNGRILVVEDDPMLAGMMVDLLLAEHYEVDGPHSSVSDGMAALATHMPDGAVVDLHHPDRGEGLLKDDLQVYAIPFLEGEDSSAQDLQRRLLPWLRHMRH